MMSVSRSLYFFVVILVYGFAGLAYSFPLQGNLRADSIVSAIKHSYEEGSYLNAEIEGRRFLEQVDIKDSLRIQVEKYIAFSLIAQDKPQFASSHFWFILQQDSSFNLDPELTSPKILSIFQRTREKFLAERQLLSEQRQSFPTARPITFRAIVFPGWEQLYQGRGGVGLAFMGAGAAGLLSTVYCDLRRRDARNSYLLAGTRDLAAERYKTYNKYYKGEVYSAVAYGLVYLLSEIEVFTYSSEDNGIAVSVLPVRSAGTISFSIRF